MQIAKTPQRVLDAGITCDATVGKDFVRVNPHREGTQCKRAGIYLVDGVPMCRNHAALTLLDDVVKGE